MNGTVGRVLDIVAAATILGLLLRYGDSASSLIATTFKGGTTFYNAVSLQGGSTSTAAVH
jgi:hypothetical protein